MRDLLSLISALDSIQVKEGTKVYLRRSPSCTGESMDLVAHRDDVEEDQLLFHFHAEDVPLFSPL